MVQIHDAEVGSVQEEISHDHLFRVTGLSSTNLEKMAQEPVKVADFEEAISATGFGRFNLILLLCSLPAFWTSISITSSVSYIFTKAKCDMDLSLLDMGTLNAVTYGGMISSAMVWGFLSDTLGRKQLMVWGFLATSLVEMMAGFSQNFAMLVVTKFICGFLFNGPFAVLLSYLAELHRTETRARVILLTSMFYTLASSTLPLVAWSWLTHTLDLELFGGRIVIHAWNLFLMTLAVMPAVSGLAFLLMPESPKFLMSRGRNDEAMEIFRKIYCLNTGNPKEDYPIKVLVEEKSEKQAEGVAALRGGFRQLAPLFRPPHLVWLLLLCAIHTGLMFGSNTLRLWFPQLAAMINSSEHGDLCSAIAPPNSTAQAAAAALAPPSASLQSEVCVPIETDLTTYLQSVIVGSGSVFTYGIGGFIVNRCGKRMVCGSCALLAASFAILAPQLGSTSAAVVALVTAALAFTSLCGAALSSIMVDLFPTSLRVMALAIFLMLGRLGTIGGTIAFPALLEFGCLPPFFTIALVLTVIGLACYAIPNTTLRKLE